MSCIPFLFQESIETECFFILDYFQIRRIFMWFIWTMKEYLNLSTFSWGFIFWPETPLSTDKKKEYKLWFRSKKKKLSYEFFYARRFKFLCSKIFFKNSLFSSFITTAFWMLIPGIDTKMAAAWISIHYNYMSIAVISIDSRIMASC